MTSSPTTERATYADLEQLPEHVVGELVDGVLRASPRPAVPHAHACTALTTELAARFERALGGPGGWRFLFEPELHLGDDVFVPDVAGWRIDTLPSLPVAPAITTVPDFIAEVASPSTARWDLRVKLPRYHNLGVGHVWIVRPLEHVVEAFRNAPDGWYLAGAFCDEPDARIEPFMAAPLDVRSWWIPEASSP